MEVPITICPCLSHPTSLCPWLDGQPYTAGCFSGTDPVRLNARILQASSRSASRPWRCRAPSWSGLGSTADQPAAFNTEDQAFDFACADVVAVAGLALVNLKSGPFSNTRAAWFQTDQ